MNVYWKNSTFRALANSSFLSAIGSTLFNLVFLVYAQTLPFKTLAVSIVSFANLVPTFFMIFNGYWADHTNPRHRFRYVIGLRGIQGCLYLGIAGLLQEPGTMGLFAGLVALNVISDLLADYTINLIMHYEKMILHGQTERQSALGFSAGMRNIISMVFQAAGASLIVLLHNNFSLFAVINALSFLLAGLVLVHDRRLFRHLDRKAASTQADQNQKEGMLVSLGQSFRTIYANHPLFIMLLLALACNSLGASLEGLTAVLLANVRTLWLGNFATTVAAVSIVGSLSITIAALWTNDGLQRFSLPSLTAVSMTFLVLFAVNMVWWQSPLVMLVTMAIASYPIGKINPRVQSEIFTLTDAQHLTATMSVISTVVLLGAPLGNVIFLGIANLFNPQVAWITFGGAAVVVTMGAFLCVWQWPQLVANQAQRVNKEPD
ncbi:MFS transporter [Fructilactobacillus myrtifloralis]|uniref:MFS transporter n=1 Tax=Fructilactobacillus myrtifloralis TaxID=2940301 RepID=A0ABY5BRA4_9LACO|nr:MFS transporter [Fructilactobacillus myrtifloralis]USS84768.1 MFS transporter [Fructilactobacillus myrtifloralis]